MLAFSSSFAASYAVSVRQASVLPAASSGFHLAMDTLAVRLTIPPAGFVEDFHLRVSAPCRAHKQKAGHLTRLLTGGRFFQDASKGLKQPENKGGKKPRFRRSLNQRKPI
jgi:hypothetical protein